MKNLTSIFALIIIFAVLAVIFAIQNAEVVEVKFIAWEFATSLALIIMVSMALGGLLGLLSSIPGRWKSMSKVSSLKKEIADLKESMEEAAKAKAEETTAPPPPANEEAPSEK